MEPECDALDWVDNPDDFNANPTASVHEAQVTRLARRMPGVQVPGRPRGVVGLYDVTGDWIPIYDRTALDGFYVAIGTSGNQFKNAPIVGQLMRTLIDACENGHDHDASPVQWRAPRTQQDVNLGHYSRRRELNPDSSYSVLG
jgi:glycine/D-amino acid oxidase-like deaminating enzyme